MKKLSFVLLSLIIISSCKDKDKKDPIAVGSISFSVPTLSLKIGETHPLKHVISPENAANKKVTYKTDKADILEISSEGVVTAKALGEAKITVTTEDGNKTATCTVAVIPTPVTTITLAPGLNTLGVGVRVQLTATVMPENASVKAVTWQSSSERTATVDNEGWVTGRSRGSVIITATATDGSNIKGEVTLAVKSSAATVSAITLGAENFSVAVPTEGATTTININNAPRTISSILTAVPVNITAAAEATIKVGERAFRQGQVVNFSNALTFTVTAEDGTTTKTYTVAITAYNKITNPYGVYNAAHLNDVRNNKDGGYKMMNNITLPERNRESATLIGISDYEESGWLAIGNDAGIIFDNDSGTVTNGFTGIFDGGNFSIDNFYINRTRGGNFAGLFGAVSGATISNVGITGSAFPAAVTGSLYVGALAGYIVRSSVNNCYTSANVHVSTRRSINQEICIGGLLGLAQRVSISNSYSSGDVSGQIPEVNAVYIGGLLGRIDNGTISNCFAVGDISSFSSSSSLGIISGGGLVGFLGAETTANCYATGTVLIAIADGAKTGGFAGEITRRTTPTPTFTNCYRNSAVVGMPAITTTGITAKARSDMQTAAFAALLNNGASVPVWEYNSSKNDGLPYIKGVGVGK